MTERKDNEDLDDEDGRNPAWTAKVRANDRGQIGGYDFVLPKLTPKERDRAMAVVRDTWPEMIREVVPEGASARVEMFVYRDEEARQAWVEHGATDETGDTMLHLIFEAHQTTLVAHAKDSETGTMCRKMLEAVGATEMSERPGHWDILPVATTVAPNLRTREDIELKDGTEIRLSKFEQHRVYEGLLEGLPTREMNERTLKRLRENPPDGSTAVYIIEPIQTPIAYEGSYPFGTPARLPSIQVTAWFESRWTRDPQEDYSRLVIVWFQDEFGYPFAPKALEGLRGVPWRELSTDATL
jgi:hypothetical protein